MDQTGTPSDTRTRWRSTVVALGTMTALGVAATAGATLNAGVTVFRCQAEASVWRR